jgi:hypothetical protein
LETGNLKVKILHTGPYRFVEPNGHHGARRYQEGDEVEFKAAYAIGLIRAGLVEQVSDGPPEIAAEQIRERIAELQVTVDWSKMTVVQLKDECRRQGLSVSGRKRALVTRLENYDSGRRDGGDRDS